MLKEMHFGDVSALVGKIISSKILKTVLNVKDSGERKAFSKIKFSWKEFPFAWKNSMPLNCLDSLSGSK